MLRQYEKDIFININSLAKVNEYQGKWIASRDQLTARIDDMEKIISSQEDKALMKNIRENEEKYSTGTKSVIQKITSGEIKSTQEANAAMSPFKDATRNMVNQMEMFFIAADERVDADEIALNDRANKVSTILFAVILTMVVSGIAIALIITRSITQPLSLLQATITTVESSSDFTRLVAVDSNDEVGQTAKAFNRLMCSMRVIIQQTREAVDRIAEATQGLASSTEQATTASQHQAEATSTVAASTEQITVTIGEIATHTKESESLMEYGHKETLVALGVTHEGIGGMRLTAQAIKDSVVNVSRLSDSSRQISGIVVAIKEIAYQTDLLALNAAIEAARAGQQGRGFSVVADEVRKLAERTGRSTEEISLLIGSIQGEIEQAVRSMSGADAQASSSLKTVHHAEDALGKIGKSGASVNVRMKEIANSITECDNAMNEIAKQIEKIAQMTEENSAATAFAGDMAKLLDGLAASLLQSVAKYAV